ncbi:MAG: radical SAM protein, partial [Burkholderiaceae bacterium]|nr:radical SAM protein [Burkholderiaceae bacterium]
MKSSLIPLPPHLKLRAPKRQVPEGTIDCHAHIFDQMARYPMDINRKYTPPECSRDSWLNMHRIMGVHRGVQVHGSIYGFDNSITEDFVKRLRATGKVCDHFHLSLQSGCDETLKRMNRKYDTERFFEATQLLREYFPNCGMT